MKQTSNPPSRAGVETPSSSSFHPTCEETRQESLVPREWSFPALDDQQRGNEGESFWVPLRLGHSARG